MTVSNLQCYSGCMHGCLGDSPTIPTTEPPITSTPAGKPTPSTHGQSELLRQQTGRQGTRRTRQEQGEGECVGADLAPLARLEAAVGVHPEQLAVAAQQVHVQEGLDLALDEVNPATTARAQPPCCRDAACTP